MISAILNSARENRDPSEARRSVCLLLEGTYPYVAGGVSTWVHQIIEAMPEIDFSVHFIGDQKQHNAGYKYELPPNVTTLTESYLFDPLDPAQEVPGHGSRRYKEDLIGLLEAFVNSDNLEAKFEILAEIADQLRTAPGIFTLADLAINQNAWELLTSSYEHHAGEDGFDGLALTLEGAEIMLREVQVSGADATRR